MEGVGVTISSVPMAPHNSFDTPPSTGRRLDHKGSTDTWHVFRRLADPKQPVSIIRQCYMDRTGPTYPCTVKDPPNIKVTQKSGVRCMCFENVIHFVRQVCCKSSTSMFRIQEQKQPPTSWMKSSKKHFLENDRLQFPLASVVARWQHKRYPIDYDHALLHMIFSKFGTVREIRKLSPNSVLVIFEELTAACHVIHSQYIGIDGSKLHCRWWHKCMENKVAIAKKKGVKVQPVPFL